MWPSSCGDARRWRRMPPCRGRAAAGCMPRPRSPSRSPFQRDRDRIIHSTAFRRLKHKTQVFVYHEGDHYRTRLTHSLEVAQIARTICRTLGLDEDLAEAVALAHDLGHTPFGHAGEEALHAAMKPFGGFDHNAQTLRILTKLEERYAEFDGLNLTWETLEGAVKHNGPLLKDGPDARRPAGRHRRVLPGPRSRARRPCRAGGAGRGAERRHRLQQPRHRRRPARRPVRVADLLDLPLVGEMFALVSTEVSRPRARARLIHEAVRRVINAMVEDVMAETRRRLADAAPKSVADIRALGRPVVAFSEGMAETDRTVKKFLFERMYEHWQLNRSHSKARRVVMDLFGLLFAEPNCLPPPWRERAEAGRTRRPRPLVADYIAGMTDRFALDEHRRLFDLYN